MGEGGKSEKSFLEEKYPDLHQSEEVEKAVRRQETRIGEEVRQEPKEKIEAYLDRLDEVFNPKNPDKKERRVDILKDKLHELFIIKPEDIPESYFDHQKRIAREQGHGDIEVTDGIRGQMAEIIIHDQAKSLDAWVDYLGLEDAPYPNWLKYFAFRSITKLSEYDKEKHEFKKRSKSTTAPFPDINREALAYVLDAVEKSHKKESKEGVTDEKWEKLLKTVNFGKLYSHAIEKITPASQEDKENIQGEWVKYEQGSDAEPLYTSLQGHGTGWCTAGEGVAKTQLQAGDFYVYYTKSKKGNAPRVAIRMQEGEIAEIRGIDADQNLEGSMTGVAKEKMKELPGAEKYEKRVSDMKQLTEIEKKTEDKKELTKDELKFLYEINGQIDGFGYQKDPRVKELQERRNIEEDMLILFECKKEQIAHSPREITKDTRVYLGKLEPGIFELAQLYSIENIYTSFPEGNIRRQEIEIGGKNAEALKKELEKNKIKTSNYANDILASKDFTTLENSENITLVRLKVRDLGFEQGAITDEVYEKANDLGLELCPAEIGPCLRLKYTDQPMNEWLLIGMKQITPRDGSPLIFDLERREDGLWLCGAWALPDDGWRPARGFVFRLLKKLVKK